MLLAKVAGVGAPGFVVWTFMDECFSATSNILGVSKKVVWSFLAGSMVKNLPAIQETGIKTMPMEKKCRKAKWLSGEALQIAVKRREVKSKGEKEVPKNSKKR